MLTIGIESYSNYRPLISKKVQLINKRLLIGRWRSDEDKEAVILFRESYIINFYGKKTIDTLSYFLSNSCSENTPSKKVQSGSAFLHYLSRDSSYPYQECFEIETLDDSSLTYTGTTTGKIYLYKKILLPRKQEMDGIFFYTTVI
jgi:hypothetical protein